MPDDPLWHRCNELASVITRCYTCNIPVTLVRLGVTRRSQDERLTSTAPATTVAAMSDATQTDSTVIELDSFRPSAPPPPQVTFHRTELDLILRVYGRKVADGEWRDYAIDFQRETAVFSCFRRASEVPQVRIVKDPRNARRQGAWSVLGANGTVLKRGHELAAVLRMFDRKPKVVS